MPDTCSPSAPEWEARGSGIPDQPRVLLLLVRSPSQGDPVIAWILQMMIKVGCKEVLLKEGVNHTSTDTHSRHPASVHWVGCKVGSIWKTRLPSLASSSL